MSQPRIIKLFLDTHMGLGHDGLSKLAQKQGIKLQALKEDDLLMFVNTACDKMKVLGAQGKVIGYLKLPGRQKIMLQSLQYIPATFSASGFDYQAACRIALRQKLGITFPA